LKSAAVRLGSPNRKQPPDLKDQKPGGHLAGQATGETPMNSHILPDLLIKKQDEKDCAKAGTKS
jgi:hypothetical protein